MTKSVLVFGDKGKTTLIYGLLKKLSLEGFRVGYFKPIAKAKFRGLPVRYADPDIIAIKEALNLRDFAECMNPILIVHSYLEMQAVAEEARKRVIDGFSKIREGKDIVMIEGIHPPEALATVGLSVPDLVKMLNAKPVLLINVKDKEIVDEVVDVALRYKHLFERYGIPMNNVVLNCVPIQYLRRVEDVIVPHLNSLGLKVYGVTLERPRLSAPIVKDIVESLGAEVLINEDKMDSVIEDILVGAMETISALKWFRRAINAAIITGGDRTDLILAALDLKPSVIILTGNLFPAREVLAKAKEARVPLLLVPYDTYTTVMRIKEVTLVTTAITVESLKAKEDEILHMIEREVAWKSLLED